MEKTRIVLFDDNSFLRDSLSLLIGSMPDLNFVAGFEHVNDLVRMIEATQPEIVIMDIDMPGMNGIEAVKIINQKFPKIMVLMQTVFEDDDKVFPAIQSGAHGYILKNARPEQIISAIYDVREGGSPMSPGIARKVLSRFQSMAIEQPKSDYNLSTREKEVLALLVEGQPLKNVADRLFISYDTVRSHIKKIYEKLHVSSMTEAVSKTLRENLLFLLGFILLID
jgi:DNA-binding NarL/FixJ family response regulator